MADPTLTNSGTGEADSATPSATFGFTGTSGRLLVFSAVADAYITGGPSGFTQAALIGSTESAWWGLSIWYKISAGTESSTSYTLGASAPTAWAVAEFDSVDGTPLDVTPTKNYTTGNADTWTSPSITPSSGRRLVVTAVGGAANYDSPLTGASGWTNSYTEAADVVTTGMSVGVNNVCAVAYLVLDGGTATTTTATYDGNSSNSGGAIAASFKVAAAGTPATVTPSTVAATASVTEYTERNASVVMGGASKQGVWA